MKAFSIGILITAGLGCVHYVHAAEGRGVLQLAVKAIDVATVTPFLDPAASAWSDAPRNDLHFSRTPPLYVGDATDDGARPVVNLKLLRTSDGSLLVRAQWTDPDEDVLPTGARYPDAGAKHVYKEHSEAITAFADAFCVMVPVERGAQSPYPSMMMGEKGSPVQLYYWRAGIGFQLMSGHGRASTAPSKDSAAGRAVYADGGWTVTLAIPNLTPQTPLCFAIWEGHKEQRDGLKYFSLWYDAQ